MKIKNKEVEPAIVAVNALVEQGVDIPTTGALKVRDLAKALLLRQEIISAVQKEIFQKYGRKKDDGSLDMSAPDAAGRMSVPLIPETQDEALQKLTELLETECDMEPVLTLADLPDRINPRIVFELGPLLVSTPTTTGALSGDVAGPGTNRPKLVK